MVQLGVVSFAQKASECVLAYCKYLKFLNELLCIGSMDNNLAGAVADEAFLHGLVDECQQGVVIAIDVQQANLEEFSSVGFTELVNFFGALKYLFYEVYIKRHCCLPQCTYI